MDGAQSWVEVMAELATEAGVRFELEAPVQAVEPSAGWVRVGWAEQFAPYIAEDRFPLLPGVCFIHQDQTILVTSKTGTRTFSSLPPMRGTPTGTTPTACTPASRRTCSSPP